MQELGEEIEFDEQKRAQSMVLNKLSQGKLARMRQFVEKAIDKGDPYKDPEFPAEYSSLYNIDIDFESDGTKFRKCSWKRASEIYEDPYIFPNIFAGSIQPSDIKQGTLGNSDFLGVLSSMAERPERIEALIETKDVNDAGIYLLTFFINGIETPVIVDDYLPVLFETGKVAFAHSKEGELWVSLLEKGWAKLHGSYAGCEFGKPCLASMHLSGVPSESFQHKEITN